MEELQRAVEESGVNWRSNHGWSVDEDMVYTADDGSVFETLEEAVEAFGARERAKVRRKRKGSPFSRWENNDDTPTRRVVDQDFSEVSFQASEVNCHLVCMLCDGYFRNAHTITECLHTFCRSCLLKYINDKNTVCPRCRVPLGPHPMSTILHDRTMQTLVDKMFPESVPSSQPTEGGEQQPQQREGGSKKNAPAPATTTPNRAKGRKKVEAVQHIGFKVEPSPGEKLKPLPEPYLRTSSTLKVMQLSRYLAEKLGIDVSALELVCSGEVLAAEHSLQFIKRTLWFGERSELIIHYRKKKTT